jgi:hypothetical protein
MRETVAGAWPVVEGLCRRCAGLLFIAATLVAEIGVERRPSGA